ncbi:hypothetical protein VTO42DRAFT_3330 [Malbranchea cinnamomea]
MMFEAVQDDDVIDIEEDDYATVSEKADIFKNRLAILFDYLINVSVLSQIDMSAVQDDDVIDIEEDDYATVSEKADIFKNRLKA